MTAASYPLERPPAAALRGGDCRARDLNQGRNVHGGHRFATPAHCRIDNGLLRLTLSAAGTTPALTIQARRGAVVIGDVYEDVYSDLYGGSIATPSWLGVGTITIDSLSVTVLLTAVRLVRISAESLTLRLVAPAMRDAFVTLRRGEPMIRIQHGSTRPPFVDTDRRVRFTAALGNLLTANQSSLETDETGWIPVINCAVARSTAQAAHGVASLAVTAAAGGDVYASTPHAGIPVTEGETYTALISSRAATTPRSVVLALNWWDADSVFLSTSFSAATVNATGGFTQSSVTAAAPAGAAFVSVVPVISGLALGEVHYLDKASLAVGASVTWQAPIHPAGIAELGRVEETAAGIDGMYRFVAAIDPVTVNAGAFSVTASSVISARFGAGVGTSDTGSRPMDLHRQLADASTQQIVVA